MDTEFHYYMTYLIAARAGYPPNDALIIANSAQQVDDNHILIEVGKGSPSVYRNIISQTMDILHPRHADKIYPVFHFIPGNPDATTARRKDGQRHTWVTTPDSPLAQTMMNSALKSRDLYRIGASAHAFVDTWAHQNFVGKKDDFNIMQPALSDEGELKAEELLAVGHALAKHNPDLPGLVWTDRRLIDEHATVDNKVRFLDAAGRLFQILLRQRNPNVNTTELLRHESELRADLNADIGAQDSTNSMSAQRITRYQARALTAPYGGMVLPTYVEHAWAAAAFNEDHVGLFTSWKEKAQASLGSFGDVLEWGERVECTWKNPAGYRQTDWHRFQEAVKSHLDECWNILIRQIPEIAADAHHGVT